MGSKPTGRSGGGHRHASVGHALGATASKFDANGRQSAVDFMLEWPNGRRGALEVTLVTEPESAAWQGMAAKEGWRRPAPSGWEFRLAVPDMPYHRTRRAVLRAVALCDRWSVDAPHRLPAVVLLHVHQPDGGEARVPVQAQLMRGDAQAVVEAVTKHPCYQGSQSTKGKAWT